MTSRAVRVTFEKQGDFISICGAKPVNKRAYPGESVSTALPRNATGVWVKLMKGGDTFFRRHVGQLFTSSCEVLSGNPEAPFVRKDINVPQKVDTLIPLDSDINMENRYIVDVTGQYVPDRDDGSRPLIKYSRGADNQDDFYRGLGTNNNNVVIFIHGFNFRREYAIEVLIL